MAHDHPGFWLELAGKICPPILAATLVGGLLSSKFEPLHLLLIGVGFVLISLHHWSTYHGSAHR